MWLFILLTQLIALSTCFILWWFFNPQRTSRRIVLVLAVLLFNNLVLAYGLSDFWHERFRLYLLVSILQGFLLYAFMLVMIFVMSVGLIYYRGFHRLVFPRFSRLLMVVVSVSLVGLAVFNAYSPVVHRLTVHTDKPLPKPMRLVLVSDTHLGKWFGNRQLDRLVTLVGKQQPDVVLMAGDMMDNNLDYYQQTNMQAHLSKLTAPLGVYAVLGNHDYMGQDVAIADAIKQAGLTVLDNEAILLNDALWLVGRSDDTDNTRLSAKTLLSRIDTTKPIVFLEHRPSAIDEISKLPIDLHVSGHTHGGQIFPLTLLMDWFTPLNHGSKYIGNTQFLVSSGYGFGSVPFRLGTRSEIWVITLQSAQPSTPPSVP